MKIEKLFRLFVLVFALALPLALFADEAKKDQKESPAAELKADSCPESVLSCIMSSPECSIFARAIHDSGLEDVLASAKECTIFAPTNKAFEGWDKKDLDDLFGCKAALSALVLNHVCPKSLSPELLKKLKEAACCCNPEDCEKMMDKEMFKKAKECCPQLCEKMKKLHKVCTPDGRPCLGSGKLCHSVKAYPTGIVKCNNGYVYTINKVQVPRGLRVYRELQKEQAENDQAVPVVVVEEVQISAEAVPVANPPQGDQPQGNPVKEDSSKSTSQPSNPSSDEKTPPVNSKKK
ncbi:MAG: fasciclin domain-containing protein [Planctomycetia bacterium]|nr:fasciclin domain-containing protein [Planctomycetia bacterium]